MRRARLVRGSELSVMAAVAFCAFALGGAPRWVVPPLALLSAVALGLAAMAAREEGRRLRIAPLAVLPLAVAALCLLQLMPLPQGLVARLNPTLGELVPFALAPLGLAGRWRPLTLDAPRTVLELAKHLSYAALVLAAADLARSMQTRRRLIAAVALTGTAVAALGLLHALVGAQALLGVVRFREAGPPLLTPFGNPNHLAGYLALAGTCLLGLILQAGTRERRWAWGLAFGICAVGSALSLSRAGVCFFVLGALLFTALRRERGGALAAGVAAAIALAGYVGWERLLREYGTLRGASAWDLKVGAWPSLARAALAFPSGMGRGAFALGFARFQERVPYATVTHAENEPLQLAAELGPFAGVVLVVAAAALLAWALRARRETTLELAALCGVVAVALHNLFDFSLELPAAATAVSVVLGAAAPRRLGSRASGPRLPAGVAVSLGAVAVLAALLAGPQYEDAESRLATLSSAPGSQVRAASLPLLARHPADHALWVQVGAAYVRDPAAPAEAALAFLNRALWLRPADPAAHVWTARGLMRLGRTGQALVEYRLAHERGAHPRFLLEEALPLARDGEALARLAPEDAHTRVDILRQLLSSGRAHDAVAFLDAAPPSAGDEVAAWEARALREAGHFARALERAELGRKSAGETELLVVETARALDLLGRRDDAQRLLRAHLAAHTDAVSVALLLAEQEVAAGRPAEARTQLGKVHPRSPEERARLLQMEAASYAREGRRRRAVESLAWVTKVVPDWPEPWFELARALEALGRYDEAAEAIRAGQMRAPERKVSTEAWLARLQAARERALLNEGATEPAGELP